MNNMNDNRARQNEINKNNTFCNIFRNPASLKFHSFFNTFICVSSFVIFYRNSHYFKINPDYLSRYWGIFLIVNTLIFFTSGFTIIGIDFLDKYKNSLQKYFKRVYY